MSRIDHEQVRRMAESAGPLADEAVAALLRDHRRFVMSGGAHGSWTVLEVGGLPLAVYQGASGRRGAQASLRLQRLPEAITGSVYLPFADLCGALGEGRDLRLADLTGSLLADGLFAGADLSGAILRGADLSRADLRGCRFDQASLDQADLENADLRGASLRGASLAGARLFGARLQGAVGLKGR